MQLLSMSPATKRTPYYLDFESSSVYCHTHLSSSCNETTLVLPPRKRFKKDDSVHKESSTIVDIAMIPSAQRLSSDDQAKVEEYTFSSENEFADDNDYDSDMARSHISLSSSDSPQSQGSRYTLDDRPWLYMDLRGRHAYETMFLNATYPAVGESWVFTEDYQHQLDLLMRRYIEDFPLSEWTVGQGLAQRAFHDLCERTRWRELGVRVYSAERLPELLRGRGHPWRIPVGDTTGTSHTPNQVYPVTASSRITSPHLAESCSPAKSTVSAQGKQHTSSLSSFDPAGTSLYASILLSHAEHSRSKHRISKPDPQRSLVAGADDTDDDAEVRIRSCSHRTQLPPRATTPPYPVRKISHNMRSKPRQRQIQSRSNTDLLPWNRQIDFRSARQQATWDDKYCNPSTTADMRRVRAYNAPIVTHLDADVPLEKGRLPESMQLPDADTQKHITVRQDKSGSDLLGRGRRHKKKLKQGSNCDLSHHAGALSFAGAGDERRARAVGCMCPDDLIEDGELNKIDDKLLGTINLCWRPWKNASTHDLQHATFTALESVITRRYLATTPVLTWPAAECVIDFCPDLLWHDILVRVLGESGMTIKDVRTRLCQNGCYIDNVTFTGRISAALGKDETLPASKDCLSGSSELYKKNSDDFSAYIQFFGKRNTFRCSRTGVESRALSGVNDIAYSTTTRMNPEETASSVSSSDDIGMDDAVSIQDSDDLDALSD